MNNQQDELAQVALASAAKTERTAYPKDQMETLLVMGMSPDAASGGDLLEATPRPM